MEGVAGGVSGRERELVSQRDDGYVRGNGASETIIPRDWTSKR